MTLALPPRFCREPGDKCSRCWGDGWCWLAEDGTSVLQEDADEGEPHGPRQMLCAFCQGTGSARRARERAAVTQDKSKEVNHVE